VGGARARDRRALDVGVEQAAPSLDLGKLRHGPSVRRRRS
jgi:hypothetical protein